MLYCALIAALALTWVVPQESLVGLPIVPRFLAGSALAFAPIYLANLIFAQRFSGVDDLRGPRSPPTCSAPWSAGPSSTWP